MTTNFKSTCAMYVGYERDRADVCSKVAEQISFIGLGFVNKFL
jgi:hypothetical protein